MDSNSFGAIAPIIYEPVSHSLAEVLQYLITPVLFSVVLSFFIYIDGEKYKLTKPVIILSLISFGSGLLSILNFILIIFVLGAGDKLFYYSELVLSAVSIVSFFFMFVFIIITDAKNKNYKLTKSISITLIVGAVIILVLIQFVIAFFGISIGFGYPRVDDIGRAGVRNIISGKCAMADYNQKLPFWLKIDNSCFR